MASKEGRETLTSRFRRLVRDKRPDVQNKDQEMKFRWSRIVRLVKLMSGPKFSKLESEKVRDGIYLVILSKTKILLEQREEDDDQNLVREFASFLYRSCEDSMLESKFKERAREMGLRVKCKTNILQEIKDLSKKLNEFRYRHSIPEYGQDVDVSVGDSFVLPPLPSVTEAPSSFQQEINESKQDETSAELCRWLVQIAEHHIVMTSSAFEPQDLAKTILRTYTLSVHLHLSLIERANKHRYNSQVEFGTGDTNGTL